MLRLRERKLAALPDVLCMRMHIRRHAEVGGTTGVAERDGEREVRAFRPAPAEKNRKGMDKLHLLIWKQLIALLVRIEGEGEKFSAHKVWAPAWIRFEKKVLAHKEKVDMEVRRSVSRGEKIRDMRKKSRPIEPFASYSEEGDLTWNESLVKRVKELGKLSRGSGTGGRGTS